MLKLSGFVLRIALAVPMAYETYRIGENHWHALQAGVPAFRIVLSALPVFGLPLGCVLVIALPHARWTWLAVAADGLFLLFVFSVDVHSYYHLMPSGAERSPLLAADARLAAVSAYAVLLASACLLARPRAFMQVTGIEPKASRP